MSEEMTLDTPDVNQTKEVDASTAPKKNEIPVENRLAEMNRKFSGLTSKLDQLIVSLNQAASGTGVDKTQDLDSPRVDAVSQLREELMVEKHKDSFKRAVESFPELDSNSESFDDGFYKETDALYRQLLLTRDPEAPLKAAKFVALERGKFAQLERNKVFADESRRSRVLSEGGINPRQATKPKDTVPENLQALAKLLGADQSKLKSHIQANNKRYRLGE